MACMEAEIEGMRRCDALLSTCFGLSDEAADEGTLPNELPFTCTPRREELLTWLSSLVKYPRRFVQDQRCGSHGLLRAL